MYKCWRYIHRAYRMSILYDYTHNTQRIRFLVLNCECICFFHTQWIVHTYNDQTISLLKRAFIATDNEKLDKQPKRQTHTHTFYSCAENEEINKIREFQRISAVTKIFIFGVFSVFCFWKKKNWQIKLTNQYNSKSTIGNVNVNQLIENDTRNETTLCIHLSSLILAGIWLRTRRILKALFVSGNTICQQQ